ncbi:MAG: HAD-IA family hydrolase [Ruminococcus sp.]|nr:HAD-IA family hydrolase [Ruminococcus sp.]
MKDHKAFIFDFDLTLADSSKGILMCFKHTLAAFGYPVPDDDIIKGTIGLTIVDSFDVLTGIKNNPQREQMKKFYTDKANEVMSANTFFYEDTVELLTALRKSGRKVGIVSTKMRYRIEESFEMQTGAHPYDIIVGVGDVSEPKPSPMGLLCAMESLGVNREDVLYVGDSYIDAETAKNAGVDFGAVTTGTTTRYDFEKHPHLYIEGSLKELLSRYVNKM